MRYGYSVNKFGDLHRCRIPGIKSNNIINVHVKVIHTQTHLYTRTSLGWSIRIYMQVCCMCTYTRRNFVRGWDLRVEHSVQHSVVSCIVFRQRSCKYARVTGRRGLREATATIAAVFFSYRYTPRSQRPRGSRDAPKSTGIAADNTRELSFWIVR